MRGQIWFVTALGLALGAGLAFPAQAEDPEVKDMAKREATEHFDFQPTPDVKTFGQLIGHITWDMYVYCSSAAGLKTRVPEKIEGRVSEKTELLKLLEGAHRVCDEAYASMDDVKGKERLNPGWREGARLSFFVQEIMHSSLHYGNMVTYMRLKGIVPASTVRRER